MKGWLEDPTEQLQGRCDSGTGGDKHDIVDLIVWMPPGGYGASKFELVTGRFEIVSMSGQLTLRVAFDE